ncbi:MAG: Rpn family recombination-promoting nuclease/putative transposase [Magnetococcales bacterium]|nr:Rpn family recombination-promoting nuclease/putative transposase [Magnetococcales bacterium]
MKHRQLISFDWALKRLLRNKANFDILEGFLGELLRDEIHIVEILEGEGNQEVQHDKYNRVDLKVKNGRGELIVIELQYEREIDYLQRLLYGTSKVITEHMSEGESYSSVVKVISVSILYFDLGQGSDYVYRGTTTFRGLHDGDELSLSEGQKVLFHRDSVAAVFPEYYLIRVNCFDNRAHDTLDEWIYFLKNEEIREEFTARGLLQAKKQLDIMKLSESERRAYERYKESLHDQASLVESTYGIGRLEGFKEGLQEGLQEGRQEGQANTLLRLLHRRFNDLPAWAEEKVTRAATNELDLWSDRILDARSIEELFDC